MARLLPELAQTRRVAPAARRGGRLKKRDAATIVLPNLQGEVRWTIHNPRNVPSRRDWD
jgi:hypothetical protein